VRVNYEKCVRWSIWALAVLWVMSQFCSCSKHTANRAGEVAAMGTISGSVGGLVSGLVFGENPAENEVRGAVYGGATGAAMGGISGGIEEQRQNQQQEDQLAKLREKINDDAFEGLTALAECRHDVCANQAKKAKQSNNPNFALAGLWLQVLGYADRGDEAQARSLFPAVVEKDWDVKTEDQAEAKMRRALNKLMDIRQQYDLPIVCK
jgi:hypothetical protein